MTRFIEFSTLNKITISLKSVSVHAARPSRRPYTLFKGQTMTQEYFRPRTVQEALSLLQEKPGQGRVIAGGTDLLVEQAKPSRKSPRLVDLGWIPGMKDIREEGGFLVFGACVTHSQAEQSPLVRRHARALAEGCGKVGSRQIRNMGTLAGNIVSALPAADAGVTLTALGAVCVVASPDGVRELPMTAMYHGVGKSAVNACAECITQIKVPLAGAGTGSAYARMEQRKALSLPMLCVAARVTLENGLMRGVSIVMAPAGPAPRHAAKAERLLEGQAPDAGLFARAGAARSIGRACCPCLSAVPWRGRRSAPRAANSVPAGLTTSTTSSRPVRGGLGRIPCKSSVLR